MSHWYRTAELPPPLKVTVRVTWGGEEFRAARLPLKVLRVHGVPTSADCLRFRDRPVTWVRRINGALVMLPRLRDLDAWGLDPPLYQPVDPGNYPHPLPLPVGADNVRAEYDRPHAVLPRLAHDWWRDALPTYSDPGAITPREAEGRVMRALMVEASLPAVALQSVTPLAWLARMIELVEMIDGKRPTYWHDRFQPTARDLSDLARVIPWLSALGQDARALQVLRMRAASPPYSWQSIADLPEVGISRERVRQVYRQAIALVTRVANGQSHPHAEAVARQMQALRERNRAHAATR